MSTFYELRAAKEITRLHKQSEAKTERSRPQAVRSVEDAVGILATSRPRYPQKLFGS